MPRAEVDGSDSSLDVQINSGDFESTPDALLEHAVRLTCADSGCLRGEISVTLLPDADIRALNEEYLSHDRPTDVLAFSLGEPRRVVGDVYIGVEEAVRQATDLGVALDEELTRLAIHGVLHVLGHDHPAGLERASSPMFVLQERLLREALGKA
jgi:probable rRNA maturation factor